MKEIKAECSACGGTGLYCGFAEPKGTAVVCHGCSGTGCDIIRYRPFTKRKRKRNVTKVFVDGGLWFARTKESIKQTISIKEFYEKFKM